MRSKVKQNEQRGACEESEEAETKRMECGLRLSIITFH